MFSRRRPSRSTRAVRALTALITVWCLGCSALNPVIRQLAGLDAGGGMVCGADDIDPVGMAVTGDGATTPRTLTVTSADDATRPSVACDCRSCCAPAPTAVAVAPQPPPSPQIDSAERGAPPSLPREPLVPPPQRVA